MAKFPNDYFDVAIVDPPYFSGPEKRKYYGRKVSPIGVQKIYGTSDTWDVPNKEAFQQVMNFVDWHWEEVEKE